MMSHLRPLETPRAPSPEVAPSERQRRLVFDILATRSLALVAETLREAGVPFAPVKGIVLARWLYPDVTERRYVDVDLLVPRSAFQRAMAVVDARGWPSFYRSTEMGEFGFTVDHIAIEFHAEVGRRDLSRLSVDDVLARATADTSTFSFEVQHIDDVDHFLLLMLNVVKDGFTYANPHQPADLERMLERLTLRLDELIERSHRARLMTALHLTAEWMVRGHDSAIFENLRGRLPEPRRPRFLGAARLHAALDRRQRGRLSNIGGILGLALATQVPDDGDLRRAGLRRVLRRGAIRKFGRDPG